MDPVCVVSPEFGDRNYSSLLSFSTITLFVPRVDEGYFVTYTQLVNEIFNRKPVISATSTGQSHVKGYVLTYYTV